MSRPAAGAQSPAAWTVRERHGSVRQLHTGSPAPTERREIWIMRPEAPALVLGSGQRRELADAAALAACRLPVLRRRSGGGAVLVRPGDLLWVDVVVPPGDPVGGPDAGAAFEWLGRTWQQALAACGVTATMHAGPAVAGRWGSLVCFAGVGRGELCVDGAKVLGLSQRRGKAGVRLQSAVVLRWRPEEMAGLLAPAEPDRAGLRRHLAGCAAGLAVSEDRLLDAFVEALAQ